MIVEEKTRGLRPEQVADRLIAEMTRTINPEKTAALMILEELAETMQRAQATHVGGDRDAREQENMEPWYEYYQKTDEVAANNTAAALLSRHGIEPILGGPFQKANQLPLHPEDIIAVVQAERSRDQGISLSVQREALVHDFGGR